MDIINSPIGKLGFTTKANKLITIEFLPETTSITTINHPFNKTIYTQLEDFFKGKIKQFVLPFQLNGTEHQKKVWHALTEIPYGQTTSYGELAKKLNSSPRAIGNACRCNPIPVIIPCHRVVAKNGIGGYSGDTKGGKLTIKEWLLQHEAAII